MAETLPAPTEIVLSSSELKLGNGSSSNPSLSFANDSDTGLYRKSANILATVAGGNDIIEASTDKLNITKPVSIQDTELVDVPTVTDATEGYFYKKKGFNKLYWRTSDGGEIDLTNGVEFPLTGSNGSVAAPSYSFTNDTASGMFLSSVGNLTLAAAGETITLSATNATFTTPVVLPSNPSANLQAATKQYVDDFLPLSGGTLTGSINMGSQNITNVASITSTGGNYGSIVVDNMTLNADSISSSTANGDISIAPNGTGRLLLNDSPTSNMHAATKQYVDNIASGLDVKASVRVASTANIDLATGGLLTIDGITLIAGNRVLVKNQTTGSQNGIYDAATGSWSRSSDADSNAEVTGGIFTFVEEGTANAGTGWVLSTPDPITVDTTSLTFVQFSASPADTVYLSNGTLSSARMITMNGNDITFNGTANVIIGDNGVVLATGTGSNNLAFARNGTTSGVNFISGTNPGFQVSGNSILNASSTGLELYISGSNSMPSIYWNNDTNTGLFRDVADQIGITTGGSTCIRFRDGLEVAPLVASSVSNANSGTQQLFLDSSNNNHLSRKDESGNVTDIELIDIAYKSPVVAATVTAGTLSTDFANGDTIDGITLSTGDRLLIKNQTSADENGIYVVQATGAPSRANDFKTSADFVLGTQIFVQSGTVNAYHVFYVSTYPNTVDTDNWEWAENVGADNFGNHTATTDILMASNNITQLLGSATAPAIRSNIDASGLYFIGAGRIGFTSAGSEVMRIDNTGSLVLGASSDADASAIADLSSTSKGILIPRMTKAQRDAITVDANRDGLLVYNTDTKKINTYDGSDAAWKCVIGKNNVTVSTTDDTVTTIATLATANDKAYGIHVKIVGRNTTSNADMGYFDIKSGFINNGGTLGSEIASIDGSILSTNAAAWTITLVNSGTNILVQVTGAAATNISWNGTIEITNS